MGNNLINKLQLPFLGITNTKRVEQGGTTAPVNKVNYTQPSNFKGNLFAGIPEETPPVITGGTHITGLGRAGEVFDSYKLGF